MKIKNLNNEKLRLSRKKRKISMEEVSKNTGIPIRTLQKYETGEIKKIPLEVVKKISKFYGTDYYMYFWWTGFTSLFDIILHFIYFPEDFREDKKLFEILGIMEYFDFDIQNAPYISLYNKLTVEEKEEYQRFKIIVANTLKSDKYFTDDELKKEDIFLFCYFFAHKIKREKQINLEILKEDKLKKV